MLTTRPFQSTVEEAAAARERGWWSDTTLSDRVRSHAHQKPNGLAYVDLAGQVTWAALSESVDRVAAALAGMGVRRGDRVAVWMPDSATLHIAFLAVEVAGATIVGIGARSGQRELAHMVRQSGARHLLTSKAYADEGSGAEKANLQGLGIDLVVVTIDGPAAELVIAIGDDELVVGPLSKEERVRRRMGPDELFLINSTSGTTGLPKCVLHTQNRWHYFHTQAQANGALTADDVFLSVVPAPFGFGLWTSHFTPITLGTPTVLLERFTPEAAFSAIERHGATVLCCVSTQFIMMLASEARTEHDLSSLRVMFTGGEPVPYERAVEFERLTGATTLQFYGSNETGLLSGTNLSDPPEVRLRTAGQIRPEMQVRLFDGVRDVTAEGRGQPGCRGPATSLGYLEEKANDELYTADGWMLMGDICEIDEHGNLTVVGRTSDFIIRGGKNISAPQIETDVATHPAVAHVAVVAMPDPVFGERICAYVELVSGADLDLDGLRSHLEGLGISKELYPERLVVLDELPRSSGAKVAKGVLREDIRCRLDAETTSPPPSEVLGEPR